MLSWAHTSAVWAVYKIELVGFVSSLVVNEKEEGVVALHLPTVPAGLALL